jgi:hypothetical protein
MGMIKLIRAEGRVMNVLGVCNGLKMLPSYLECAIIRHTFPNEITALRTD